MKAAIDIGTNTVLLLVAEKAGNGLNVIEEQQRIPRLGRGVDQQKVLATDSMNRVIEALKEYRSILKEQYPDIDEPTVTATSAVRDAGNRGEFIQLAKEQTGFEVIVLSGTEEAEYTFRGAQSVLDGHTEDSTTSVLDIGGGSTEVAMGKTEELTDAHSYDMGCVRFTERFLDADRPSRNQVAACRSAVKEMLQEYRFEMSADSTLIGVAGTATSAACIVQDLESYDAAKINGYRLTAGRLDDLISRVSKISPGKLLQQYPEVMEGRADIFLAGLLIMEGVMKAYGFDGLTVSTGGIRHGAVILAS